MKKVRHEMLTTLNLKVLHIVSIFDNETRSTYHQFDGNFFLSI